MKTTVEFILGLTGSPRKGGNTDIMLDALLGRAAGNGHRIRKIYLADHAIGPCTDCRRCKQDRLVCPVADGMQELYPLLDSASVIVFGTPVYFCGPSGPMKLLMDRLRPYFANGRLRGKRALLVAPAKDGPPEADLLTEMFCRSCGFLGMEFAGCIAGTAYDRGDIRSDREAMARLESWGAAL